MKKKLTLLLFFLAVIHTNAQIHCKFDAYRNSFIKTHKNELLDVNKKFQEFVKSKEGQALKKGNFNMITIPVVFHVVHNGEFEGQGSNISDDIIKEQLAILNNDFSKRSTPKAGFGLPTLPMFNFCLAKTDPFGKPTNGIVRTFGRDYYTYDLKNGHTEDDFFIKTKKWNPDIYLNIYITDLRPKGSEGIENAFVVGGYSSIPEQRTVNNQTVSGESALEGIVMNYRFIGLEPNYVGPSRVQILTHEVGHWLGLFHVFDRFECFLAQGNVRMPECELYGDLICDTPIMVSYSTHYFDDNSFEPLVEIAGHNLVKGCLGNTISSENFMDYGEELSFFTEKQVQRMHEKTAFYRRDIYNETYLNSGCTLSTGFGGNSGGTGGGDETHLNPCNNSITDDIGYKITATKSLLKGYQSTFGISVSLENNTLAVADGLDLKVYLFNLNKNCSINQVPIVLSANEFNDVPGDNPYYNINKVYLKDNRLFVSVGRLGDSGYHPGDAYILIFEKSSDVWVQKQVLVQGDTYESSAFGYFISAFDDDLLIGDHRSVFIYRYNGEKYIKIQTLYISIGQPGYSDLQYNGKYLAVRRQNFVSYNNNIDIFYKDSNGLFVRHESNTPIKGESIALSDASENYLYSYDIEGSDSQIYLKTHNLDMFTSSNSNNSEEKRVLIGRLYGDRMRNLWVIDNLLVSSYPIGIRFRDRFSSSFYRYATPGVNPYYLRPFSDGNDVSLPHSAYDVDGEFIVAANERCGEVYVYNVNSIFAHGKKDIQICEVPTDERVVGKNITAGGNCKVNLTKSNKDIVLEASKKIIFKPGTSIFKGGRLTTKITESSTCNFSGGFAFDNKASLSSNRTNNKTPLYYKAHIQKPKSVFDDENEDILLYPNPTKGILLLKSRLGLKVNSINIINLSGTNIKSLSYNGKTEIELDLTTLPKGVYFIQIYTNEGNLITEKVIKD